MFQRVLEMRLNLGLYLNYNFASLLSSLPTPLSPTPGLSRKYFLFNTGI
jgi:hypothetical protein